jgi:DNA replication protein DnaC
MMTLLEQTVDKLRRLRLMNMAEHLAEAIDKEKEHNHGFLWLLDYLIETENESRWLRAIENRHRNSKLIDKFLPSDFEFKFHASRQKNRSLILRLSECDFIEEHKDIIFIGNPGTGKTRLAKTIAHQACLKNKRVLFTTAIDMINNLIAARSDQSLLNKLKYYQSPSLLVCDELGFLSLDEQSSGLFFQVLSARHDRVSTIVTTNLPFSRWAETFQSAVIAQAIADRLVQNSEIILLEGPSYRQKNK